MFVSLFETDKALQDFNDCFRNEASERETYDVTVVVTKTVVVAEMVFADKTETWVDVAAARVTISFGPA